MRTLTEEFVVSANGRRRAVILPIEKYRRMKEDLRDLAVIAERRKEPSRPLREYLGEKKTRKGR